MAAEQQLPVFDHSAADFSKVGPRRAHMEQYFRALGLWNADLVEELRAKRVEELCAKLRENNRKKVSQLYFEYAVDYGVWYNLLDGGKLPDEDHPWPHPVSAKPDRKDFSEGASWYYRDWLLRNGPLPKSKGESSKAPKSEAPAKDMAAPGPQTQPAVVAETSQKSATAAKDTKVRYDPSIPFGLQAKRAAAAETARQSSVTPAAPKPVLGQQARRPLDGKEAYGISSSIWAPKPAADHSAGTSRVAAGTSKVAATPVDRSADVSKVTAAIAAITFDAAAGQSAKKEKEEEKASADAQVTALKAERLYQKKQEANDIFNDELEGIANLRFDIRNQQIADAKAKAKANGCSEDDWVEFEEYDDREAIMPLDADIPVRHDFGVNAVTWAGPMQPNPEYLEEIWDGLHLRKYKVGPIIEPFEIALPKWMDFHDLVLGNDGCLFDMIEDEGLIDTDVVISWSMGNHGPASLIVGPKLTRTFDSQDKNQWLRVRNTWMKVAEWVAGVYKKYTHRLTDFLRYRQQQEMMGVSFMSLDDVVTLLVKLWNDISDDEEKAAYEAKLNREELDLWIPQIHAILSQEYEYASKIAKAWVFRDVGDFWGRLRAIEYAWALFQPIQAYEWARDILDENYSRTN